MDRCPTCHGPVPPLRACPGCGTPFYRTEAGRSDTDCCSPRCSARVRKRRQREREEAGIRPVMLHEDGTDCSHEGQPAGITPGGIPLCAGGQPVTHIRIDGQVLTIEQAGAAFQKMTAAFSRAFKPIADAFAEAARRLAADPAVRALAARDAEGAQR